MGEMKNAYKTSSGKSEVCRPLAIPRNRWDNNIKMRENSFHLCNKFK
jgi:hypothetical protein